MSVATFSPTVLGPIDAVTRPICPSTLPPLRAARGTIFNFSPDRQLTLPGIVIPAQILTAQNLRIAGIESWPAPNSAGFVLGGQEFNGLPIATGDGWIVYNFLSVN